ncbi:MAG: CBS domain-containing protein, partial [Halorubrum sp.]
DPDINQVPVVDDAGRIVGIIARQDVIRAFRDKRLD